MWIVHIQILLDFFFVAHNIMYFILRCCTIEVYIITYIDIHFFSRIFKIKGSSEFGLQMHFLTSGLSIYRWCTYTWKCLIKRKPPQNSSTSAPFYGNFEKHTFETPKILKTKHAYINTHYKGTVEILEENMLKNKTRLHKHTFNTCVYIDVSR
jgi:hypothetical protein